MLLDSPVRSEGLPTGLDQPPPGPPLQQAPGQGLGGDGQTSLVAMALQRTQSVEEGLRGLANVLPGMAPFVLSVVEQLRRTVPQILSSMVQSGSSMPPAQMPGAGAQIPGGPTPAPTGLPPGGGL